MRRSFGMGMGGGGGRGMIKNVHGALRAGSTIGGRGGGASSSEPPPFSTTSTTTNNNRNNHQPINTALSLSSNNTLINHHPLPPAVSPPYSSADDSDDWECIYDDINPHHYTSTVSHNNNHDDFWFGAVPSKDEVHHALSSLQQVVHDEYGIDNKEKVLSIPPNKHQVDWTEPSLELCNLHQVPSCTKVYDAFHLMQTDPSVQRMVISLSSDKAVWDAVMNNEVVRELGESIGEEDKLSICEKDANDDCNPVKQVLRWMFVNTKDRVVEIVERITKIVNGLVQPNNNKEEDKPKGEGISGSAADLFQEKLRSSFFLSIMVLFIVVVSRGTRNAS